MSAFQNCYPHSPAYFTKQEITFMYYQLRLTYYKVFLDILHLSMELSFLILLNQSVDLINRFSIESQYLYNLIINFVVYQFL